MSTTTNKNEMIHHNVDQRFTHNADEETVRNENKKIKGKRSRKKSLVSRVNSTAMKWTRRIHLFSGLFMLPWVLLYGFTAMLFNHSTWFADSQIESVSLDAEQLNRLPVSRDVAEKVVAAMAPDGFNIVLADSPNAQFTRSAIATYQDDKNSTSLVIDLNSGSAYQRIRKRSESNSSTEDADKGDQGKPKSLAKGIAIHLEAGDILDATELVEAVTGKKQKSHVTIQSIPNLEFDAVVNGERKRLRFSQQSQRRRGGNQKTLPPEDTTASNRSAVRGTVTSIGDNPRDLSWRSYLLRLHLSHGYPVTKNARYWWAYAVDAMFVCMVFWGFSGIFMWWQIKRTRVIGFVLLFASFVIAAYLAFAMHWQMVNG